MACSQPADRRRSGRDCHSSQPLPHCRCRPRTRDQASFMRSAVRSLV